MKYLLILLFFFSTNSFSEEDLPSTEEICKTAENEIRDLELMKRNLKIEFKNINNELEQFEMLPKLSKDINEIFKQQLPQAKLYHYLDCSRFDK